MKTAVSGKSRRMEGASSGVVTGGLEQALDPKVSPEKSFSQL